MDTAPAQTVHAHEGTGLIPTVRSSRRRRRPTGAPPPLPRTFHVSSAGWLVATLALIVVFAITFAASRHGAALAVTAADDRVVRWFAELRGPWLPRWGRWLVVAAVAAVFLARMYVGAHLPLDMVGGAALGLGIGVAARLLLGTRSAG